MSDIDLNAVKVGQIFRYGNKEYIKTSASEGKAVDGSHAINFAPTEKPIVESSGREIING